MKTTITRHKGGTAEKTQPISKITIPDLWHIAQGLKKEHPHARDAILDVWHLAHDLKRHIEEQADLGECGLDTGKVGSVLQACARVLIDRDHDHDTVINRLEAYDLEDQFRDACGGPAVDWLEEQLRLNEEEEE